MPPMLRSKNSCHKKYVKAFFISYKKMSKVFCLNSFLNFFLIVASDQNYEAPITFVSLWLVLCAQVRVDNLVILFRYLRFSHPTETTVTYFSGYHLTFFLLVPPLSQLFNTLFKARCYVLLSLSLPLIFSFIR